MLIHDCRTVPVRWGTTLLFVVKGSALVVLRLTSTMAVVISFNFSLSNMYTVRVSLPVGSQHRLSGKSFVMYVHWLPKSKCNFVSIKVAFARFEASTRVVCTNFFTKWNPFRSDSLEFAFSLFFDTSMVLTNFWEQRLQLCSLLSSQWTQSFLLVHFLDW